MLLSLIVAVTAPTSVLPPIRAQEAGAVRVLHCGMLLADPGDEPLERATVVVEGERIREVLEGWADVEGGEVVDLRDLFVMPGWIDCHTHITHEHSQDIRLRQVEESEADAAIAATVYARRTLEAGFTTIRNVGSSGDVAFALRDAIAQGLVPGPRILCAGYALTPSGGHGDKTHGYREGLFEIPCAEQGVADGPAACRQAVRVQVKRGADLIKLTATGGVLSATNAGTDQQFFEDELDAIVQTAHMLGRRVAAHAHGADGIRAAVLAGVDSIEHGSFLDDACIEAFLETGAFLVPTLMAGETVVEWAQDPERLPPPVREKAKVVGPVMMESLGKAHRAGVRIAFGTDSGVSRHGENAREFDLMVEAGVPNAAALYSATMAAAELCALDDELGSLAPDKRADVIALRGNPLEDIRATHDVVFVMRDGVVHERPEEPRAIQAAAPTAR